MSIKLDRRYIRTQALLQNALLSLIRERPFHDITINDITERAGVARKTFYAHHANKEELLWVSIEEEFRRVVASMSWVDPETLLIDGKPMSYALFKHVQEYAVFYRSTLNQQTTNQLLLKLWDYIAQVSYEKHAPLRAIAPNITVPPPLIAQILAGAVLGAVRWWIEEDFAQSPETMGYTFSQLLAPGVMQAMGFDF